MARTEERHAHICLQVGFDGASARLRRDPDINNLPRQHGPWVITGAIAPGGTPPHNFSREAIEKAITASGFQLWRLRESADVQS